MAYKEYVNAFKNVVPELTSVLHKGSNGRVGVIGGSLEYTGAPYFAAISALKAGADLVHVFCTAAAAPVIKAYSPELIVHPVLDDKDGKHQILEWSQRLDALVVGPGLGRKKDTLETVCYVLHQLKNIPVILDADGIYMLTNDSSHWESLLEKRKYIVTPNAVELERLKKRYKTLPSGVFINKGAEDVIVSGNVETICTEEGSPRRCGGQGDVLSGITGIFAAWAVVNDPNQLFNAAVSASTLTRRCSYLAFQKYKRSMVAGDLIEFIGPAFEDLFNC